MCMSSKCLAMEERHLFSFELVLLVLKGKICSENVTSLPMR